MYSDYVGDVRLADFNDNSIANINAWYDTVSSRVLEGDEQDNWIYANDYGCSLWGGTGGDDWLRGGSGDDTFRAGQGEGNTYIGYCNENDLVELWNINLNELSLSDWTEDVDGIVLTLNDSSAISIQRGSTASTTTVQYADGTKRQYNYAEHSWQSV